MPPHYHGSILIILTFKFFNKFKTFQIFIDSHTWIYISRKRNDYAQVEEQQQYAIAQQQQQQMQNHQNMAHRTLPRQQNG